MQRTLRFAATLTPDTELGGYVAEAVGFGVFSQGETVEDAKANLREALELYFEDEPAKEVPTDSVLASLSAEGVPVGSSVLVASVDVRLSA